jgi:hypothetical protein
MNLDTPDYFHRGSNDGLSQFEAEIDKRVEFLYFHQSEAPTYVARPTAHNHRRLPRQKDL